MAKGFIAVLEEAERTSRSPAPSQGWVKALVTSVPDLEPDAEEGREGVGIQNE